MCERTGSREGGSEVVPQPPSVVFCTVGQGVFNFIVAKSCLMFDVVFRLLGTWLVCVSGFFEALLLQEALIHNS